jgi:hypothetical protein
MQLSKLKRSIAPFLPAALTKLYFNRNLHAHRRRFEGLGNVVGEAVAAIAGLTEAQCVDANFLENEFIPSLGLNDETLEEQPPELSASFGKGLHIWQYPSQLAAYLVWLAKNAAGVTSYMEIGCRWGGMFILMSEWIQKNGGKLNAVTAVDIVKPTPFIETYFNLLQDRSAVGLPPIQATYLCGFSTSSAVRQAVDRIRPDLVFIDGDHGLRGVLADHMLNRNCARIVVHHDVCSQACPDTTFLWESLKVLEAHEFDFFDFVSQYPSVKGKFLGIGVMKRKILS